MDSKESTKKQFVDIGIEPKVAEDTLKNAKLTQSLLEVIGFSKLTSSEKRVGNILEFDYIYIYQRLFKGLNKLNDFFL